MAKRRLQTKRTVVVTGDVTIDWHLATVPVGEGEASAGWSSERSTKVYWQRGGALLLADLVEEVLRQSEGSEGPRYEVLMQSVPDAEVSPHNPCFHHSWAMWTLFPSGGPEGESDRKVWRVERALGLDVPMIPAQGESEAVLKLSPDPPEADLVVLDDAALGYREQERLWPQAMRNEECAGWILVKMGSPVARGRLWEQLISRCAHRLVAVVTVDALRRSEVKVSRGLSWEQTAEDLFKELTTNLRVNALARCAHAVISFGMAGALWLSPAEPGGGARSGSAAWDCRLLFDPESSEGMWGQEYPGEVIGYNTCLAASIARQLVLAPAMPDLAEGIQGGVAAMRRLHEEGYGSPEGGALVAGPRFPLETVAGAVRGEGGPLAVAVVRDPEARRSILDEVCLEPGGQAEGYLSALDDMARRIVIEGHEKVLRQVPLGKFGDLVTADRREIEGFRSIRTLIAEYCKQTEKSPLSIAVFGPPGSGKSFGVKQVASSVTGSKIEDLTFNLSQFNTPEQLVDALHQVRDIGLAGKIPLVFWDEFDTAFQSRPLGWLRYFLSPMQDGTFQQEQITHHIGQAIFVFAGGTCERMADFDKGRADAQFRESKGPDFVSRLRGFIDIVGPNPQGQQGLSDDRHYIVRRAILLRSMLQRRAPWLFGAGSRPGQLNIDPGVLRAFLTVAHYRHGARSMAAVIGMSTLAGKRQFDRSCLPSEDQLNLHVDGREFLFLVEQEDIEKLASAAHEIWADKQRAGPDPPAIALLPYAALPEEFKRQNCAYVRDIAMKLASVGYLMVPAREETSVALPSAQLEKLAEMEHDRWLQAKAQAGWSYGPERDDHAKKNPAMLSWHSLNEEERARIPPALASALGPGELPEETKKTNRDMVCQIPMIVQQAGYTIIPLPVRERALRIGMTGHRFLAAPEKVRQGIEEAVDRIKAAFPGQRFVVLSSLAEGAQRLITEVLLGEQGSRLMAVLPMPVAEYRHDFSTPQAKAAFTRLLKRADEVTQLPAAASRDEAYEQLGRYVADQADVLIAVWDGKEAQGEGGTGEIVRRARERGIPVLHIKAGNRKPGTTEPTSLGKHQGELVVYNL